MSDSQPGTWQGGGLLWDLLKGAIHLFKLDCCLLAAQLLLWSHATLPSQRGAVVLSTCLTTPAEHPASVALKLFQNQANIAPVPSPSSSIKPSVSYRQAGRVGGKKYLCPLHDPQDLGTCNPGLCPHTPSWSIPWCTHTPGTEPRKTIALGQSPTLSPAHPAREPHVPVLRHISTDPNPSFHALQIIHQS